jgi:hypothetical protein
MALIRGHNLNQSRHRNCSDELLVVSHRRFMMQFKKVITGLALGMSFTAFAQAAFVTDLGSFTYDGQELSYERSASGTFSDWYTFSITDGVFAADALAKAISIDLCGEDAQGNCDHQGNEDQGNGNNFTLSNLRVSLYMGTGDPSTLTLLGTPLTMSGGVVSGTFTFDPAVSQYTLLITGNATGTGNYGFSLIAQAVPEPAEYAMLLAGLGLIGAVARRRKV